MKDMKTKESFRRIVLLLLSAGGLAIQIGFYAISWYTYYAKQSKLEFWNKGNLIIIGFYGLFLFFFSQMYGGLKIGYLKSMEVFFSQVFATICANIMGYLLPSLFAMRLVNARPMLLVTLLDIIAAGIWIAMSTAIYQRVSTPRDMLLVSGERSVEDIVEKFKTRRDKYNILYSMNISQGSEAVCKEVIKGYNAIIIWDIPVEERNKILKFCFGRSIRVYMMPKITDVLIKGASPLHLFDTPILLMREYVLTIEQRAIKRLIDVVCALLLTIITSPIMLLTAIVIKAYDRGPVLYKQVRCTINQKEFAILKFRSMKVDAEKDGVARLAAKNDDRITPIGKFIRGVRIDELPQLFNILKGEMSFIGPRPERPEIIARYLEDMPEFAYRMKVKAGLAGYAQVYGKYNTTPYDKLKLDLTYIEDYSTWLDIKLMLLTLKILFKAESTEGVDNTQITARKEEN